MQFTFKTLGNDQRWACTVCNYLGIKGSRIAHWTIQYDANGGGTNFVCDDHIGDYAKDMVHFRNAMLDAGLELN